MEKLLYIACVNLDDRSAGIPRKVISQYQAFEKYFDCFLLGYWEKDLCMYASQTKRIVNRGILHRRLAIIKESIQFVKTTRIHNVYIRRFPCNPFVLILLRQLKIRGAIRIFWEIPTYPYDNEFTNSFKAKCVRFIDTSFRCYLRKYIDRIVTFSGEKSIFGIPTINTGNGIDVGSIRPRAIHFHGDEIRLIAAAVLNNWHGYDRLLYGLANYKGNRKVIFHLIGNGPCYEDYLQLSKRLGIGNSVVFYGSKTKEEIEDIYDECDIAVESLGWHRSKVKIGTSIKTREYLAKGLPIIASSPMDIFPKGWTYAYYAPIDDSPIKIEEVVEFYEKLISKKTKEDLNKEIREIAYDRCDMKAMMNPIIKSFIGEY